MQTEIRELIHSRKHCVLATAAEDFPYCSLMAYAASRDAARIYLATYRHTRKYRNLQKNPRVSLLIDSRERMQARALTIEGEAAEPDAGEEREKARQLLLEIHPHMQGFLDEKDTALLCVKVRAGVFADGLRTTRRFTEGTAASCDPSQ